MLSRIAETDVGAVGALLVWPSGVVQHGGVVLGPNFAATHAFNDRIDSDVGYTDLLRVAHECSAVTAACMVTRRSDYLEVSGMDEVRYPVNFNDVDYCLKLRALGKRIVFTPHAKLRHLESASRGLNIKPHNKARYERELQNLRAKWGNVLAADPYYSPTLSLDPIPFSALAWPTRAMEPRVNDLPVPTQVPPGF
jgi:GT2 family glycosyltransferase